MSENKRWQLVYYKTAAGVSPVREYVADLDAYQRARATFDLDLLQARRAELGAPYVRKLGEGLWELRTTGSMQHRVVFFLGQGRKIVLLHSFAKRARQTSRADFEMAKRRMLDYRERIDSLASFDTDGLPTAYEDYDEHIHGMESNDPEFRAEREFQRPKSEFRKALIEARLAVGLTQKQVAQRAGTSQSAIARLESGRQVPGVHTLYRLALILGVEFTIAPEQPLSIRPHEAGQ